MRAHSKGMVFLVGAGPGDSELITVAGKKILKSADCVIYDYLVDKKLLRYCKSSAEKISVESLSDKKFGDGSAREQDKINKVLIEKALAGKIVCRLKNGDPLIFGRASQEIEALRLYKIPFKIIPGVTSGLAAAAMCEIPVTDRRYASVVSFIAGHEAEGKEKSLIEWGKLSGTLIFYMAVENLKEVVRNLLKNKWNKNTPVAIVINATKPSQRLYFGELSNILKVASRIQPPAIVIVGEAVKLRR